jgi:hypothetical protein
MVLQWIWAQIGLSGSQNRLAQHVLQLVAITVRLPQPDNESDNILSHIWFHL